MYTGEETELAVTVTYCSERKFSTKGVIIIQFDFCYQVIYVLTSCPCSKKMYVVTKHTVVQ